MRKRIEIPIEKIKEGRFNHERFRQKLINKGIKEPHFIASWKEGKLSRLILEVGEEDIEKQGDILIQIEKIELTAEQDQVEEDKAIEREFSLEARIARLEKAVKQLKEARR